MGRRNDLIQTYSEDLKNRCAIAPDPQLLNAVFDSCGPLAFDPVRSMIDTSDPEQVSAVRRNFLVRRLALDDSPGLDAQIMAAIGSYAGESHDSSEMETSVPRVVLYYLLVVQLGAADALVSDGH